MLGKGQARATPTLATGHPTARSGEGNEATAKGCSASPDPSFPREDPEPWGPRPHVAGRAAAENSLRSPRLSRARRKGNPRAQTAQKPRSGHRRQVALI